MKLIPDWLRNLFDTKMQVCKGSGLDPDVCIPVDISKIQTEHAIWVVHNFPSSTVDTAFKGMVEELGELSHALLKEEQGIREFSSQYKGPAPLSDGEDAIADLFIFMLDLCNKKGWDMNRIIARGWREVQKRDWRRFPLDGVTPINGTQTD